MSERYICLRAGIKVGDRFLEAGETFEKQPWMGSLIAWEHNGHIRRLDEHDVAIQPAKQVVPEDIDGLTKAELIDLLDGLGLGLNDVEGTGTSGAVLKTDIVRFIKSRD